MAGDGIVRDNTGRKDRRPASTRAYTGVVLPTFLVIGAKKAGTSSLHRYLGTHPDVFVPEAKRVDFFSGVTWDRGVDWYAQQFPATSRARARGEVCNSYTQDPVVSGVARRARSVVPDVRLVYLVRHPIDRIESHYRQAVGEWGLTDPIDVAVRANPGEFVAPSRYGHQAQCWLEEYPADQLLVITAEDLHSDPASVLSQVFEFIGVETQWSPPNLDRRYNRGTDHRRQAPLARRLRAAQLYGSVRHRVPKRLRHRAWLLTSRPPAMPPGSSTMGPDLRAQLLTTLQPDLAHLASIVPGLGCWGLLDGQEAG